VPPLDKRQADFVALRRVCGSTNWRKDLGFIRDTLTLTRRVVFFSQEFQRVAECWRKLVSFR